MVLDLGAFGVFSMLQDFSVLDVQESRSKDPEFLAFRESWSLLAGILVQL